MTNPILELKADPALEQEKMSPARTPPTFIAVVRPDKFSVGCVNYMAAVQGQGPAELHVFSSGGHGGCFDRYPLLGWGYESARFLRDHEFLDEEAVRAGEAWLRKQEANSQDETDDARRHGGGGKGRAADGPGLVQEGAGRCPRRCQSQPR